MLENYNPNWLEYQELWKKYGENKQVNKASLTIPKLSCQEDSVKWSLKLKEALSSLVNENSSFKGIIIAFIDGTRWRDSLGETNLEKGLGNVFKYIRFDGGKSILGYAKGHAYAHMCVGTEDLKQAKEFIKKFNLFFDFNSIDDLFLSEENDIVERFI